MPIIVICRFRPREGMAQELLGEVREHLPTLWRLGLATPRKPIIMRASDGSILEVFEWQSEAAVNQAHSHPDVLAMWARFERCCTYETLAGLTEFSALFPHFEPIDVL